MIKNNNGLKNRVIFLANKLVKRTGSKVIFIVLFSLLNIQLSYSQTFVEQHGQLRVQGNRIVDKNGAAVQLRGMSLYWSQWIPKYYNFNTVKWLRDDWCINVIRVAMAVGSGGYETNPTAERNKVITGVDAAISLGIYVIIDFHDHEAQNKQALAKQFFSDMAQRYGNSPNVLYETFNEPLNVSWSGVIKPYHESVITSIRQFDPDNIIICGTRNWSQQVTEAAADPINKPNIAYTLHYYAASHKQWLRDAAQSALNSGIALFVTEYGTTEASGNGVVDAAEARLWWDFLNKNSIGHCNWSVADIGESSAALTSGASVNGGWTTSQIKPSGQLVRNELKARCGVVTNTPPTVSITAPANNASFTAPASISITANASDANGTVSNVQFFNGTILLGTDATAPYSFSWTGVAAGTYTITAKATDNAGAVTTSTAVSVKVTAVSNTPPTVSLTAPANNASFIAPASISISANAIDANGVVSNVQFFNGTTLLGTDATAPYSFSWTGVTAGTYSITAKATDNAGAVTSSTAVSVTVTGTTPNAPPTVSITAPANNTSFTAPASISITANAADANGTVISVQFFNGTTLLGTDATAPYSLSWAGVTAGTYSITAKATDNAGAVTTSTAVSVTITAVTSTADVIGPDCGANNTTLTFELNSSKRANVTSYSWWYTGSAGSTAAVVGSPFRGVIQTGGSFSSGQVCVGTNLSVAPWYTSYCKSIVKCSGAREGFEDLGIEEVSKTTVSPNPSANAFTLLAAEEIQSYSVISNLGSVIIKGSSLATGQAVSFGESLISGIYTVRIQYTGGRIETKTIQKLQ